MSITAEKKKKVIKDHGRGEGRGDRGPREREGGGGDQGPAPEFSPAFLTGDE